MPSRTPSAATPSRGDDTPENEFRGTSRVRKFLTLAAVVAAVLVAVDVAIALTAGKYGKFSIEKFPGIYALFGLVGTALFIATAFALRSLLKRDEGYYDD
ncbi:MAG: hypothetical protein AAFR23_09605 [Pseudomonadota bacterium]